MELPEDAEGCAEDKEAEYECADRINQAPLGLKVEEISRQGQGQFQINVLEASISQL